MEDAWTGTHIHQNILYKNNTEPHLKIYYYWLSNEKIIHIWKVFNFKREDMDWWDTKWGNNDSDDINDILHDLLFDVQQEQLCIDLANEMDKNKKLLLLNKYKAIWYKYVDRIRLDTKDDLYDADAYDDYLGTDDELDDESMQSLKKGELLNQYLYQDWSYISAKYDQIRNTYKN